MNSGKFSYLCKDNTDAMKKTLLITVLAVIPFVTLASACQPKDNGNREENKENNNQNNQTHEKEPKPDPYKADLSTLEGQ